VQNGRGELEIWLSASVLPWLFREYQRPLAGWSAPTRWAATAASPTPLYTCGLYGTQWYKYSKTTYAYDVLDNLVAVTTDRLDGSPASPSSPKSLEAGSGSFQARRNGWPGSLDGRRRKRVLVKIIGEQRDLLAS
jgi:hypothetical protein